MCPVLNTFDFHSSDLPKGLLPRLNMERIFTYTMETNHLVGHHRDFQFSEADGGPGDMHSSFLPFELSLQNSMDGESQLSACKREGEIGGLARASCPNLSLALGGELLLPSRRLLNCGETT